MWPPSSRPWRLGSRSVRVSSEFWLLKEADSTDTTIPRFMKTNSSGLSWTLSLMAFGTAPVSLGSRTLIFRQPVKSGSLSTATIAT